MITPLLLALRQIMSARVVIALVTSVVLTAAVAGPFAVQAERIRNEQTPISPDNTRVPNGGVVPAPTDSTIDAGLVASASPDPAGAVPLDGARVFGAVYISYDGPGDTVRYYIDGATTTPSRIADSAPFYLGDPAFDTRGLAQGKHTLTARVDVAGVEIVRGATFTIIPR